MNEKAKLWEFVESLGISGDELTDDLELLKSGFLNSINFIKLLAYLRKEHRIEPNIIFSILEESFTIKRIFNVIKE